MSTNPLPQSIFGKIKYDLTNMDTSQKVVLFCISLILIAVVMVILAFLGLFNEETKETDPNPIVTKPLNPPTSVSLW